MARKADEGELALVSNQIHCEAKTLVLHYIKLEL
jgi:hypothetical protein